MEFADVTVKESPGLCRCCLSEGCYKDLGSEYSWMNDTEVYADMLLDCFDIGITQHNDGPNGPKRLICEVCITRLRDACNFKKQVVDSEKKFIDMLGRGEFRGREQQTVLLPMYTNAGALKAEAIEEVNLNEDYDDTNVEYLEDVSFTEDDEAVKAEVEPTPSTSTRRGRPRKTDVSETPEKKPKLKSKTKVAKDQTPGVACRVESELRRKNLKTILDNTTVLPFRWKSDLVCFYCNTPVDDYMAFRKHTKSHGPCSIRDFALKELRGKAICINLDVSKIACEICEEEFNSLEIIVQHLRNEHNLFYDFDVYSEYSEYRLVDFRCIICDEQLDSFRRLVNHTNLVHPVNRFGCHDCGRLFNKKRDIFDHIATYHRFGRYICKYCDYECTTRIDMRTHSKLAHPKSCGYCTKKFKNQRSVKEHIPKCRVRLVAIGETEAFDTNDTKTNLKSHVDAQIYRQNKNTPRTHQETLRIRQNIQCVLTMSTAIPFKFRVKFSCFYCFLKFDDFEVLKQHTKTEHTVCDIRSKSMKSCKGKRSFVRVDIAELSCKICFDPMTDLHKFIDHAITKHNADYDTNVDFATCFEVYRLHKLNIPCLECPKVFRYLNTMLKHFNSEHSNNNVICDYCGKGFRNIGNLNIHLQNNHIGSCECKICHGKFKNHSVLIRHMAKVHNEKTFRCPNCSDMFESAYKRQIHLIRVHGIGHKCEYCGKMFTKHSFMDIHVRRTHLKEKNVVCSVCNDKFFDNHLLKMHMIKHDGERKYKCELCGKAFLRQKNLKTHMDTHKKYGFVQ